MKANQDRQARRIGDGRAIVERWIHVGVARQNHAHALLLKLNPRGPRESERQIFFHGAGRAACAIVCTAVAGIEYHRERWVRRRNLRGRWSLCD